MFQNVYTNCYFVYSQHSSRAKAEAALEDYFATGEVVEGEHPYIETRRNHNGATRYCVMFPGV